MQKKITRNYSSVECYLIKYAKSHLICIIRYSVSIESVNLRIESAWDLQL